jgi:hypothetical protein
MIHLYFCVSNFLCWGRILDWELLSECYVAGSTFVKVRPPSHREPPAKQVGRLDNEHLEPPGVHHDRGSTS